MITTAVLKRVQLSKQSDLRFLRDRRRGRSYIQRQQKEREAEKTRRKTLGYTNTICPFDIPGNVPLLTF